MRKEVPHGNPSRVWCQGFEKEREALPHLPFTHFPAWSVGKETQLPAEAASVLRLVPLRTDITRSGNRGQPAAERRRQDDAITRTERKQRVGFRQGLRKEERCALWVQESGQCGLRASRGFVFQRRPSWNSFVCFSQGPSQRPGKMKNLVYWRSKSDQRTHECGVWQAIKTWGWGTSLVVQWLRLHPPDAGNLGSIPGQGTRSHMPQLRPSAAK